VDNTAAQATDNGSAQSWLIATHKRYDSGSPMAIKNDIGVREQPVTRVALVVSNNDARGLIQTIDPVALVTD